MISEGSCDTEDWNNNAGNSTGINYILKYNNFDQINAVRVSIRNLIQKDLKNKQTLNGSIY